MSSSPTIHSSPERLLFNQHQPANPFTLNITQSAAARELFRSFFRVFHFCSLGFAHNFENDTQTQKAIISPRRASIIIARSLGCAYCFHFINTNGRDNTQSTKKKCYLFGSVYVLCLFPIIQCPEWWLANERLYERASSYNAFVREPQVTSLSVRRGDYYIPSFRPRPIRFSALRHVCDTDTHTHTFAGITSQTLFENHRNTQRIYRRMHRLGIHISNDSNTHSFLSNAATARCG